MPVAVLFFETDRTPLDAGTRTRVEAGVKFRLETKRVERPGRTLVNPCRRDAGRGKGRRGYSSVLTVELSPAALRSDIKGHRILPPEHTPCLGVRLGATKRYGERRSGA